MSQDTSAKMSLDLSEYLPPELRSLDNPQTALPRIAKDARLTNLIEETLP
jgi:hypothetical protein